MRVGAVLAVWVAVLASFTSEGGAQHTQEGSSASTSHGNTCRYAHDGECDHMEAGTGACSPHTDTADCELQHSCQWAHDGTCDEPGPADWGRETVTSRCDPGTDSDDCCPLHAHTSAHRMQCACNANYHVDASMQECVPGGPWSDQSSAQSRREECDRRCESYEDAEAIQLCHDNCEWADTPGWMEFVAGFLLLGILFFPCLVFGVAHMCCIRDQRKDGRQPVPQAWTICTSLFVTALLCTWSPTLMILWVVLPFCMVAPFCFDQCYEDIGEGTPGYRVEARRQQHREAARRERARADAPTMAMTVQAVQVEAAPVVAQAVLASPLPEARVAPSGRTSNPLSIGSTRIAPGTTASPVVVSSMVVPESAEVGVAATFEVEDDFDDPDVGSVSTSTSAAPAMASPYRAPESKLSEFLVANALGVFEEQLRSLGAVDVPDLRELEEEDMERVGMKPLEIKRMRRGLAVVDQSDV